LPASPRDDRRDEPEEKHLLEYWHVLLRRWRLVVAVTVVITGAFTVRALLTPPAYSAVARLLMERESPSVLGFKDPAEVNERGWGDEYYQTQYKLLQSRALARKVVEEMNLLDDPAFGGPRQEAAVAAAKAAAPGESPVMERAIDGFLGRLNVQWQRNSRLIDVGFEAPRPEMAARVANKVTQLFIQQVLEFRFQTSSEAAQFLARQMEEQRKKVEAAELVLQELKEKEGIVNIEERRTLLEQKLKELGTALTALKTQRLEREALYNQMRSARNPEELPEVLRSPIVQALRIELANLERQMALLLERYLDQHPEVVRVRNQIQETRQKIAAEAQRVIRAAENDYKAGAAQEASVAAALDAAKAEALELSRRAVRYDTLKREVEGSKQVLDALIARHRQTDVAQALRSINVRVVDPAAVPRGPVRPNKRLAVMLGLIVGGLLGVGLAFFLDYLDNTVKTPEDVRTHLGMPLLAVVPECPPGSNPASRVLVGTVPQGPFSEGYRLLRTALQFSWPHQGSRVVVVTSTAPGEGKTLTSVNLALTLASTDGKVLLVDADLRKSQAHSVLRARRSPGLSDVLVGQVKPSEAIQRVASSNLSLLASGSHAPSPGDLLTVGGLRGLIEALRGFYNWIIIDSPPIGAVADALVLSPMVDGVAVVVGAEMVPRKAVRHTVDRVAESGTRVLGVVLNRARAERHSYYYSHHYSHGYASYHQEAGPREVTQVKKQAAR
jgi:capsular exopolysaccharide synthesis family protein